MKKLFILLAFYPLFGLSQPIPMDGVVTHYPTIMIDKNLFRQWDNYLSDCNTLVPDTIKQSGTVNVKYKPVIVNGEVSHYILSPIDTVWTDCKCGKYKLDDYEGLTIRSGGWGSITDNMIYTTNVGAITYTPIEQVNNKINITRNKICHIKKRKASWDDFWNRWLAEKKIIELN